MAAKVATSAGAPSQVNDAGVAGGSELRTALLQDGEEFSTPTSSDMAEVTLSADEAKASALKNVSFPGDATENVYLGRLTNVAQAKMLGDAAAKSPLYNRLAYVVQITGVDVPPISTPAPTDPEAPVVSTDLHHEINVFVDAVSGDEIMTASFR